MHLHAQVCPYTCELDCHSTWKLDSRVLKHDDETGPVVTSKLFGASILISILRFSLANWPLKCTSTLSLKSPVRTWMENYTVCYLIKWRQRLLYVNILTHFTIVCRASVSDVSLPPLGMCSPSSVCKHTLPESILEIVYLGYKFLLLSQWHNCENMRKLLVPSGSFQALILSPCFLLVWLLSQSFWVI